MTGPAQTTTRRKVVIASLIALTSMLGAVAAWRASVASSAASDAERKGFADAATAQQQRASINSAIDSTSFDYLRTRLYGALADGLEEEAESASAEDAARLSAQAGAAREMADLVHDYIDPDALRPDGMLDLARKFDIEWSLASSQHDVDPQSEFAQSDTLQVRSERLVGLTALLIAAALFFTLAQVSRSPRTSSVYLVGGSIVLVVATGLLMAVELL